VVGAGGGDEEDEDDCWLIEGDSCARKELNEATRDTTRSAATRSSDDDDCDTMISIRRRGKRANERRNE